MTTDRYTCPACGHGFSWSQEPDHVSVWCSVGNCPSEISNDGATGITLHEAAMKLVKIVEEEGLYEQK